MYIQGEKKLIYTHGFPQNIPKREDVLPKCSPSWNLISLINEYSVGYTIQEKINNDNCEKKQKYFNVS